MNGHHKHIAVAVALASAASIGIAPRPAAGEALTDHVAVTQSTEAAQAEQPNVGPASIDVVDNSLTRPHRINDIVADTEVRLTGNVCTGTPITGTIYVITAAHCVLTETGEITQRTVERNHHLYPAVAVLVDTAYLEHRSEKIDVAVLILAEVIPGPSARLGSSLPDVGNVTLVGYQPIDSDGSLLRGHRTNDHPLPKGATGTRVRIPYGPAACVEPVESLEVTPTRVLVPCGLVPGASGGALFSEQNGELVLVGILSTVTGDESQNGIVPLEALHKLLDHPEQYAHGFSAAHEQQTRIARS